MDRRGFTRVVHVAKRQLALDDDCYRDLLEKAAGVRSAAEVPEARFNDVIRAFEGAGFQLKSNRSPRRRWHVAEGYQWRCVALWLSLWNLGAIDDGSPKALDAFVKRQAGVEALRFLTPGDADKVIEALKAMCARAGFEVPAGSTESKRRLLYAQWRRLAEIGALKVADTDALHAWLHPAVSPHKTGVELLSFSQLDEAARKLGAWIRKAQATEAAE